ncbi:hypothetical protein BH10BAC4_BH10BAC4_20320 [soil metagenome]
MKNIVILGGGTGGTVMANRLHSALSLPIGGQAMMLSCQLLARVEPLKKEWKAKTI